MTAALEGGEWSAARPGRTLPLGKDPVSILQEAGWASGPVWTGGKSRPHGDSIPDRPARSSVAIPTELPGPILYIYIYNTLKESINYCALFLGMFAKLQIATIGFVVSVHPSVRPSVRMERLGSHWTDCHEIWGF